MAKAIIEVEKVNRIVRQIRDDYGEDCDFVKQFDILIQSYSEDKVISEEGVQVCNGIFDDRIGKLWGINKTIAENPEILEVPIKTPLFVTGNIRTGSTYMHRLLSLDSQLFSPPVWQLENPLPPPVSFEEDRAKAFQPIADIWNNVSTFVALHGAFTPMSIEEDFWIFFRSGLWKDGSYGRMNTGSYNDWYENMSDEEDLRQYKHYKKELQLLAFNQGKGEKPYVRKDSYHMKFISTLLQVFPDARVVHLIRDPVANLASSCSIAYTWATLIYDLKDIDRLKLGKAVARYNLIGMRKFLEFRKVYDANLAPGERSFFFDVKYEDLVESPIGTMKKIYSHFGMELSTETVDKVNAYVAECAKDWKTPNKHSLEDYGFDPKDAVELYKDYTEYFA